MYKYIFLILILISCKENKKIFLEEEILLSSEQFIENKEYQISINSKDTNVYIYCVEYSSSENPLKAEYYKFSKANDKLVSKVKFDNEIYMVQFFVAKKGKVLREFQSKIVDVLNEDSSLKKMTYLNILNGQINVNKGKLLIEEFFKRFPNSLEIYPLKWKFEATNKINSIESLEKDLNYIDKNYQHNGNFYFINFIGNKLCGDKDKAYKCLDSLRHLESEYFNNPVLYPIIGKLLNVGYISNDNSNLVLNDIYSKNPLSLFTIRNMTSQFYYSNFNNTINIYDTMLLKNSFYYPHILFSKFSYLNVKRIDKNHKFKNKIDLDTLINQLEDIYSQISSETSFNYLEEKKYSLIEILDYKFVLNMIYVYHYQNTDFQKSIEYALKVFDLTSKDQVKLKLGTLKFIGNVYFENLNDLTNAKKYYFLAKSLDFDDKHIDKVLLKLYKKFELKDISFDEWVQLNLEQIKVEKHRKKKATSIVKFSDNSEVILGNSNKKFLLVFTSKTCSICNFVYKEINENLEWYNENFNLIYISKENQKDIELMNINYNLNMKEIKNAKDLFKKYDVYGVPVIVVLDKEGNQIYKEEGANENWSLIGMDI